EGRAGAGGADTGAPVPSGGWGRAAAGARGGGGGGVSAADAVGGRGGGVTGGRRCGAAARRILKALGGTEHELWTGVVLWRRPDGLQLAWQEVSRVAFRRLSDAELDAYLATRTWRGCSGAYAIKEEGDPYVR